MTRPTALCAAALSITALAACASGGAPAHRAIAVSRAEPVAVGHTDMPKGCVSSPVRLPPSITPQSGATLSVKVGAVVYVELVEPEKYQSWPADATPPPRSFPWAAARSSEPSVLRRVALCPSRGASTLPIADYAFRALRPGTAVLTAPVANVWKHAIPARRRGLHPYRATVIVAG